MRIEKPDRLSAEEEKAFVSALEKTDLPYKDKAIKALKIYRWIQTMIDKKRLTKTKILSAFGQITEKWWGKKKAAGKRKKAKKKGHGKRPAKEYTGARIEHVAHESLSSKDTCPSCQKGKLHPLPPGSVIHITGQPWIGATHYKPERLRCALCGAVFTAKIPQTRERADSTARASAALMKYLGGFAFYRQSKMAHMLGIPISTSEIWAMTNEVAETIEPIYDMLNHLAAQSHCIHSDDTNMKILELMQENNLGTNKRTGMRTTAILSSDGKNHPIGLYITGRNHAGENMGDILKKRDPDRGRVIQVCDGLAANIPKDTQTQVSKCLVHARRNFYKQIDTWPDEIGPILDIFTKIFLKERRAPKNLRKKQKYRNREIKPLMNQLKSYCTRLIAEKIVEPNSALGGAIKYLNRHWEGLTLFLKKPRAPISNNENEQMIKLVALNRKNAYFYATTNGAHAGDVLMSVIKTCELNSVNIWDYLIALQENRKALRETPENWLPWNYTYQLVKAA